MNTDTDFNELDAPGLATEAASRVDVFVMPFDHTKIDKHFKNIKRVQESDQRFHSYTLNGTIGTIAQFTWLKRNELRIFIDNFPGQKLYFSTDFPIRTFGEFQHEMSRINLALEFEA